MYYVKTKIGKEVEMKVEVHGDDIYTKCSKCGKEIQADMQILSELLKGGNLDGTGMRCEMCSENYKR